MFEAVALEKKGERLELASDTPEIVVGIIHYPDVDGVRVGLEGVGKPLARRSDGNRLARATVDLPQGVGFSSVQMPTTHKGVLAHGLLIRKRLVESLSGEHISDW